MAVNATAVWRVRPGGSNANGGGYDPGISGAGTDYSQQNAAQASGTNGACSGGTTFTGSGFTSVMVGNAIFITGGGLTSGFYFVVGYTSATSITLDSSPGTGSAANWAIGGAWADFWTNPASSGPLVPGNIVYILGSGTPNPASYTYDYTVSGGFTPSSGASPGGSITFANDPSTPGYKAAPDTTGGMPVIQSDGVLMTGAAFVTVKGFYIVLNGTNGSGVFDCGPMGVIGCVVDQNANDFSGTGGSGGTAISLIGSEIFSSTAPGSPGASPAVQGTPSTVVIGCNIHDTVGMGIAAGGGFFDAVVIEDTIISKCRGDGIDIAAFIRLLNIKNCTIDGNLNNGIEWPSLSELSSASISVMNNIISNHTGGYGQNFDSGTAAQNLTIASINDYNVYYNNSSDLNNLNYGAHDTHGGSNPYVAQSTENYTLA